MMTGTEHGHRAGRCGRSGSTKPAGRRRSCSSGSRTPSPEPAKRSSACTPRRSPATSSDGRRIACLRSRRTSSRARWPPSGPTWTRSPSATPVWALADFDRDGAAAEYAVVRAAILAPKPRTVDHVESAAVPLSALSAWQGLFDHGGLEAGQRVLIHGAAGGVGHLATQLARRRGAYVIGTTSRGGHGPGAWVRRARGVRPVRPCGSRALEPVDLVFDTVGGELLERSLAVIRRAGGSCRSPRSRRRRSPSARSRRRTSSSSRTASSSSSSPPRRCRRAAPGDRLGVPAGGCAGGVRAQPGVRQAWQGGPPRRRGVPMT